jgi:predicted dienelactone hydrolase
VPFGSTPVTPRAIPIKAYAPDISAIGPFPLILVSHGLGGDVNGTLYLAEYLCARGYIVVAVQHHGSDADYLAQNGTTGLMYSAAQAEARLMRPQDISFVLDRIIAGTTGVPLLDPARIDFGHVGIFGHSFGAFTSLSCLGATFDGGTNESDSRIDCALAMSPQGVGTLGSETGSWGGVTKPAFTMGGTNDTSPGTSDPADRRVAYDGMPANGTKYHATLLDAEHADFGNDQTFYHDWICRMAAAFFDGYLKDDLSARTWLSEGQIEALSVVGATTYVQLENK